MKLHDICSDAGNICIQPSYSPVQRAVRLIENASFTFLWPLFKYHFISFAVLFHLSYFICCSVLLSVYPLQFCSPVFQILVSHFPIPSTDFVSSRVKSFSFIFLLPSDRCLHFIFTGILCSNWLNFFLLISEFAVAFERNFLLYSLRSVAWFFFLHFYCSDFVAKTIKN